MSLVNNLRKRLADFVEWVFVDRESEINHLEFQRKVRKQKREKAAASAARD